MRATVTISALEASQWIPVNWKQNPLEIGLAVVASGVLTYSVEITHDDVFDATVTPVAFAHDTIAAKSASFNGDQTIPVTAVRLNVTAYTSGNATLTVLQGI